MDSLERIVSDFRVYARYKLEEHATAIRQEYAGTTVSSEDRLKIFNRHLDLLKGELQERMRNINRMHKTDMNGSGAVTVELLAVYNSFINEFFKKEF